MKVEQPRVSLRVNGIVAPLIEVLCNVGHTLLGVTDDR
jgi:hypothetical protein